MTITVTTQVAYGEQSDTYGVVANDLLIEAVRFAFNLTSSETVARLKALAAAFLTECDNVTARKPDAGRELAVAKTHMQTASRWAVLGATKGL